MRASLLLASLALLAGSAHAQNQSAQSVTVEVQIAHASNTIQPARVDPDCAELQKQLPMRFNYLITEQRKQLPLKMGQTGKLRLASGRQVSFMPISIIGNSLHMHFRMSGVVDTSLRLRNGKAVIVGGENYKQGRIIVVVRPRFQLPAPVEAPPQPRLHRVGLPD